MQTIIVIKVQQNMQRKYYREYIEYRIDNKYSYTNGNTEQSLTNLEKSLK